MKRNIILAILISFCVFGLVYAQEGADDSVDAKDDRLIQQIQAIVNAALAEREEAVTGELERIEKLIEAQNSRIRNLAADIERIDKLIEKQSREVLELARAIDATDDWVDRIQTQLVDNDEKLARAIDATDDWVDRIQTQLVDNINKLTRESMSLAGIVADLSRETASLFRQTERYLHSHR